MSGDGWVSNKTPRAALDAGELITRRGLELLNEWESSPDEDTLMGRLWGNAGFQVATVVMEQAGVHIPKGADATCFLTLILAAVEHDRAGQMLEAAVEESAASGG